MFSGSAIVPQETFTHLKGSREMLRWGKKRLKYGEKLANILISSALSKLKSSKGVNPRL